MITFYAKVENSIFYGHQVKYLELINTIKKYTSQCFLIRTELKSNLGGMGYSMHIFLKTWKNPECSTWAFKVKVDHTKTVNHNSQQCYLKNENDITWIHCHLACSKCIIIKCV